MERRTIITVTDSETIIECGKREESMTCDAEGASIKVQYPIEVCEVVVMTIMP